MQPLKIIGKKLLTQATKANYVELKIRSLSPQAYVVVTLYLFSAKNTPMIWMLAITSAGFLATVVRFDFSASVGPNKHRNGPGAKNDFYSEERGQNEDLPNGDT